MPLRLHVRRGLPLQSVHLQELQLLGLRTGRPRHRPGVHSEPMPPCLRIAERQMADKLLWMVRM